MAWNQPTQNNTAVKAAAKKSPMFAKGLVAGLLVAAAGAVVVLLVFHGKPQASKPDEPKQATKAIVETKPSLPVKKIGKKESREDRRSREIKLIEEKYGTNMPLGVKAHLYYLKNPAKVSMKAQSPHPYLRHQSERSIAGLVLKEPGEFFLVQPEYGTGFDNDFLNALMEKIEIEDTDTDEIRAVKEQVTAAKKEISEICRKEGKTPSEVVNAYAKSMFELGRYQNDLEQELRKVHDDPDLSDAEVEDFCKAANQLLKQKGLAEMPLPNLARRSIRLRHNQIRAEKKAQRENQKESQ